jgi:hypothetical protein
MQPIHSADKCHASDMAAAVAAAGSTPTGQTTKLHTPEGKSKLADALSQVGRRSLKQTEPSGKLED